MTDFTPKAGDGKKLYHEDPDETLTIVSWDELGDDPIPLFAVETKDDGIEVAQELVDRFGGRSRWTTVPLQRVTEYDDVTEILPKPEGDPE